MDIKTIKIHFDSGDVFSFTVVGEEVAETIKNLNTLMNCDEATTYTLQLGKDKTVILVKSHITFIEMCSKK